MVEVALCELVRAVSARQGNEGGRASLAAWSRVFKCEKEPLEQVVKYMCW